MGQGEPRSICPTDEANPAVLRDAEGMAISPNGLRCRRPGIVPKIAEMRASP